MSTVELLTDRKSGKVSELASMTSKEAMLKQDAGLTVTAGRVRLKV